MEMAQEQVTMMHGTTLGDSAVGKMWHNSKCAFSSTDYDVTVCEVWRSVTAQYGFGDKNAPSYESVERVISAYLDVQNNPAFPELNFAPNRTTDETNANTKLVNQVATNAGVAVYTAQQTLEQLYQAAKTGRVPNERILYPRRFSAKEGDPRNEPSTLEKTLKIAGGVAVGIGVCVGLYYVAKVYNLFSTSKSE